MDVYKIKITKLNISNRRYHIGAAFMFYIKGNWTYCNIAKDGNRYFI